MNLEGKTTWKAKAESRVSFGPLAWSWPSQASFLSFSFLLYIINGVIFILDDSDDNLIKMYKTFTILLAKVIAICFIFTFVQNMRNILHVLSLVQKENYFNIIRINLSKSFNGNYLKLCSKNHTISYPYFVNLCNSLEEFKIKLKFLVKKLR